MILTHLHTVLSTLCILGYSKQCANVPLDPHLHPFVKLCDWIHIHKQVAVHCPAVDQKLIVGSRRVQNNLSPKIVVKSHHYPFARIDRLSDVADTRSTDTRHKSAKFAKKHAIPLRVAHNMAVHDVLLISK